MVLHRRSYAAYVVATGAGANVCGHIAQMLAPPTVLPEGASGEPFTYVKLHPLLEAGDALSRVGWLVFLVGLLWFFLNEWKSTVAKKAQA
jgi:hypothetical protein